MASLVISEAMRSSWSRRSMFAARTASAALVKLASVRIWSELLTVDSGSGELGVEDISCSGALPVSVAVLRGRGVCCAWRAVCWRRAWSWQAMSSDALASCVACARHP